MKDAPVEYADACALDAAQAALWSDAVKARMEEHRGRRKEYDRLCGLAHGYIKDRTFKFREAEYPAKRAAGFAETVKQELEVDQKWLEEFDRNVFKVHYAMANQVGADATNELVTRYKFHLGVQEMLSQFQNVQRQVQQELDGIAGQRNVERAQFQQVLNALRFAHDFMTERLRF